MIFWIICSMLLIASMTGVWYGYSDSDTIAANNRKPPPKSGKPPELPHTDLWIQRAIIIGLAGVAGMIVLWWGDWQPWKMLLSLVLLWGVGYGSFTPTHRLVLNTQRHLKWWYMDDLDEGGNKYDEFFHMLYLFLSYIPQGALSWPGQSHTRDTMEFISIDPPTLLTFRKRVARIAYGTELTVLLASIIVIIHAN